jgi:hypothetical protein
MKSRFEKVQELACVSEHHAVILEYIELINRCEKEAVEGCEERRASFRLRLEPLGLASDRASKEQDTRRWTLILQQYNPKPLFFDIFTALAALCDPETQNWQLFVFFSFLRVSSSSTISPRTPRYHSKIARPARQQPASKYLANTFSQA